MSKKLAIKGHLTRGKEVIELLEMMGGSNIHNLSGNDSYSYYIIKGFKNEIRDELYILGNKDIYYFTLEEFLKKFPFKINDFVNIPEYESEVGICGMRWDPTCQDVEYLVYRCDDEEWYTARELLKYNDNPNEITKDMEENDKAKAPNLKGEDYSGKRFGYKIPDGYEFDTVDNGKIILKPIKPKYPTTYEECEKILGLEDSIIEGCIGYEYKLLNNFQKLLMCRDAYWKIAGEQMGLGTPWEPDWNDHNQPKFGIHTVQYNIHTIALHVLKNLILIFPTEEIRDTFHENFKDLIESCKVLL